MASAVKTRRNQMISTTVDRIRVIEKDQGVTREALEDIRAIMLELAAQTELFPEEDFVLEKDDKGNYPIYRLAEDDDHRFALYLKPLGCHTGDGPALRRPLERSLALGVP